MPRGQRWQIWLSLLVLDLYKSEFFCLNIFYKFHFFDACIYSLNAPNAFSMKIFSSILTPSILDKALYLVTWTNSPFMAIVGTLFWFLQPSSRAFYFLAFSFYVVDFKWTIRNMGGKVEQSSIQSLLLTLDAIPYEFYSQWRLLGIFLGGKVWLFSGLVLSVSIYFSILLRYRFTDLMEKKFYTDKLLTLKTAIKFLY